MVKLDKPGIEDRGKGVRLCLSNEHRRGLAYGVRRHETMLIRGWSDDSASALQGHAQNISVL